MRIRIVQIKADKAAQTSEFNIIIKVFQIREDRAIYGEVQEEARGKLEGSLLGTRGEARLKLGTYSLVVALLPDRLD